MPIFRFSVSGYVEVDAPDAETAAKSQEIDYGPGIGRASKAHTHFDKTAKTFVYVVAVGRPERICPETSLDITCPHCGDPAGHT